MLPQERTHLVCSNGEIRGERNEEWGEEADLHKVRDGNVFIRTRPHSFSLSFSDTRPGEDDWSPRNRYEISKRVLRANGNTVAEYSKDTTDEVEKGVIVIPQGEAQPTGKRNDSRGNIPKFNLILDEATQRVDQLIDSLGCTSR